MSERLDYMKLGVQASLFNICYALQLAVNAYSAINFILGRLKVNMGNIYFRQHEYSQAIKHYRMALDQVPTTHRNMRQMELWLLSSALIFTLFHLMSASQFSLLC